MEDTILKNFEELKKENNLTAYQVSKGSGISQCCLSNLKTGRTATFTAENLHKLATFFRVPMERFYDK